jgi:hypothetical protein
VPDRLSTAHAQRGDFGRRAPPVMPPANSLQAVPFPGAPGPQHRVGRAGRAWKRRPPAKRAGARAPIVEVVKTSTRLLRPAPAAKPVGAVPAHDARGFSGPPPAPKSSRRRKSSPPKGSRCSYTK